MLIAAKCYVLTRANEKVVTNYKGRATIQLRFSYTEQQS